MGGMRYRNLTMYKRKKNRMREILQTLKRNKKLFSKTYSHISYTVLSTIQFYKQRPGSC